MEATRLARQLEEEGWPPHNRVSRLEESGIDRDLAKAILSFVDAEKRNVGGRASREAPVGIYFGLAGVGVVWLSYLLARWFYGWMLGEPAGLLPPLVAAIGQWVLLRFCWRLLKASGIALTDTLNGATYPTVLHKATGASPNEDAVRYERIRLLIAEMVIRISRGEKTRDLYKDLTRIEMTRSAAWWLLVQARIGLLIKGNFPPYQNRARALMVAVGALTGCLIGIYLAHLRLTNPNQLPFLAAWAVLFSSEFLRLPRKVSVPEAA